MGKSKKQQQQTLIAQSETHNRDRLGTEDMSTLVAAVCYGDFAVVLDTPNLNPNLADSEGCTLLHWAALNDRREIASYLLEKGAKVNAKGGVLQETPFLWALRRRYFRMLDLLLSRGADLSLQNIDGRDALHIACTTGADGMILLMYLLLHWGADPNSTNASGETALMVLIKSLPALTVDQQAVSGGSDSLVVVRNALRLLLKFGASPSLVDAGGNTSIHTLVKCGGYDDLAVAFDLYHQPGGDQGTIHSLTNADGNSAYTLATRYNNETMRRFLLDALLFGVCPYWTPTFLISSVCVFSLALYEYYGALAAVLVGGATGLAVFRWLSQWDIIRHRSRSFAGLAVGWAFALYISYAKVMLFGPGGVVVLHGICGLCLLSVASILSVRFSRTRPVTVINGREEILAAILASAPTGTEDDDDDDENDPGKSKPAASLSAPLLCTQCFCDRRLASQHCLFCGQCVQAHDFHSFFFSNCVASGSRRLYYVAISAWFCTNLHFTFIAWYNGLPFPLFLMAVVLVFNCFSLIWTALVLVSHQTTFYNATKLGMDPRAAQISSLIEFLNRVGNFFLYGGFVVRVGETSVGHRGGGYFNITKVEVLWKFILSTFSKEERETESVGTTISSDSSKRPYSRLPLNDSLSGETGTENTDDVEDPKGHYHLLDLQHQAFATIMSNRSGGMLLFEEEPEYQVFARVPIRSVARRGGRECERDGCKTCHGPAPSSGASEATKSEMMYDR